MSASGSGAPSPGTGRRGDGHGLRRAPRFGFDLVAAVVILLGAAFRLRIHTTGLAHVPRQGGAVLAFTHTSHVDLITTMYHVYRRRGRRCRFLAAKELWSGRGFRIIAWLVGAIPVERGSAAARQRSRAAAVAAAADGEVVMLAPEGRISASFEVAPLHTGAARIAQAAGVPLVPTVSWGAQRISTTGQPFRWRRARGVPVLVAIGEPLRPAPDDDPVAVTTELRRRLATLLDEVQRRYPDGAPAGAWWVPARLGGGAPSPPDEDTAYRAR